MWKIISEILRLMWRVVREVFWRWLRPILGKLVFLFFIFVAIVTALALLIAGSC